MPGHFLGLDTLLKKALFWGYVASWTAQGLADDPCWQLRGSRIVMRSIVAGERIEGISRVQHNKCEAQQQQ